MLLSELLWISIGRMRFTLARLELHLISHDGELVHQLILAVLHLRKLGTKSHLGSGLVLVGDVMIIRLHGQR